MREPYLRALDDVYDAKPGQFSSIADDRGGNALALPIIFSFMLLAFGAGCAVGWWAWA